MPTSIYWIKKFGNGARLGIMPRPRGGDWLEEEMIFFQKQPVHVLVCLLEQDEIAELGLHLERSLCEKCAMQFLHFPIPDRSLPKSEPDVLALASTLSNMLDDGSSVVVHCRMGIGRSSIIAAAVLLKKGFRAKEILQDISSSRGLQVPDTVEQANWLVKLEEKMRRGS